MSREELSPIILGITGHRQLDGAALPGIKKHLDTIFAAFSSSRAQAGDAVYQMRDQLGFPVAKDHAGRDYRCDGLPECTPIWLITPLADGADTLAAIEAIRFYRDANGEGFRHGFRIVSPQAFPDDGSSTRTPPARRFDRLCEHPDFPQERQEVLREDSRCFVIPLGGRNRIKPAHPEGTSAGGLILDWKEDEAGGAEDRDAQFQAVNAYVALYSSVLIAVWDGELRGEQSCGTDGAVRLKIDGVAPHLINHGPVFNWADSGPVIQIYAKNLNTNVREPERETNLITGAPRVLGRIVAEPSGTLMIGDVRCGIVGAGEKEGEQPTEWVIIHPDDCSPPHPRYDAACKCDFDGSDSAGQANKCEAYRERLIWRRNLVGRRLFGRILSQTLRYNHDMDGALTVAEEGGPALADTWGNPLAAYASSSEKAVESENTCLIDEKLFSVSQIVERISALSGRYKSEIELSYYWLFLLIGGAATTFDVYAHWFNASSGTPIHQPWLLGALLAMIAAGAGLYYCKLQRPGIESRMNEYRSLAEGLRVQTYWMFAGLFHSVPINYMQRQRSSFDWIRNGIASFCFPYEDGQRRFDQLNDREKFKRLRYIRKSWVEGQLSFYTEKAAENARNKHHFHLTGTLTALVGVLAAFNLIPQQIGDFFHHGEGCVAGMVAPFFGVVSAAAMIRFIFLMFRNPEIDIDDTEEDCRRATRRLALSRWGTGVGFVVFMVAASLSRPAYDMAHPPEHLHAILCGIIWCAAVAACACIVLCRLWGNRAPKRVKDLAHSLYRLPLAVAVIMFLAFQFSALLPAEDHGGDAAGGSSAFFPYLLLIGLPLLWGALLIAWSEKKLFSEVANQYASMTELYRLINCRLRSILAEDPGIPDDWILNDDNPSVGQYSLNDSVPEDEEELKSRISNAQETLYELGREALDENADWLILRRAKPLEFPMAG